MRRIVELHGGSVHAISDGLGKGSEFIVRLPIAVDLEQPERRKRSRSAAVNSVPLRVLVVDDNVDAADSLSLLMKSMGHEVRTVYDGPSGIAMAQEFSPDVVMLDIGMPVMSGYDVARALRGGSRRTTCWSRSPAGAMRLRNGRRARLGSLITWSNRSANPRSSSCWRWLQSSAGPGNRADPAPVAKQPRAKVSPASVRAFHVPLTFQMWHCGAPPPRKERRQGCA